MGEAVRASYPPWVYAAFYSGLLGIATTLVAIPISAFVPSMPMPDVLSLPALAGLAALYVVASIETPPGGDGAGPGTGEGEG